MRPIAGLPVLLAFIAGSSAVRVAAQEISPGVRVRVHLRDGPTKQATGSIVAIGADALSLRVDRDTQEMKFPIGSVTRIEVSRGTAPALDAESAAAVLGLAALIAGTYLGATNESNHNTGSKILGGVLGFGLASFAVGEVFEHLWPQHAEEQWHKVPRSEIHLGIEPRGGSAISLSMSASF